MKIRAKVLLLALLFSLTGICMAEGSGAENYRIGIVTASFDQGMDELLGARAFQEKYGEDRVVLRTYPDDFTTSREKSIETISGLADDPRIMAVIVNQGVPGTAEAFRIIHEKRPEVLSFCVTVRLLGEYQSVQSAFLQADDCQNLFSLPRRRRFSFPLASRTVQYWRALAEMF